ncbi:MAG TPA: hypothetical protein VLX28_14160, partial [Thermoanaerobaculia bacterium]|nr:hypothetical protein [Thermoanaerobaculia bacterium]
GLSRQWQVAYGPLQDMILDLLFNFMNTCQFYPCLEVRDRALIVSNIPLDSPNQALNAKTMTTEKYYDSGEDFVLYEVTGRKDVVTEQMTAYPYIDLSRGDLKESVYDQFAIFRQNYGDGVHYLDFGIEICLDHYDARLRRNLDHEPFPKAGDAVHVQLIPSCGIQINQPSVAVDHNGFVFNCDGQYQLDSTTTPQQGVQNNVQCIYANYIDPNNGNYAGHTQLARVQTPATGEAPNLSSSTDAVFQTLDPGAITIVPISAVPNLEKYFAGGPGQVHIYGLAKPYVLYP